MLILLHCALSLAAQYIVIGPVCFFSYVTHSYADWCMFSDEVL